jgi:hypothetical protein
MAVLGHSGSQAPQLVQSSVTILLAIGILRASGFGRAKGAWRALTARLAPRTALDRSPVFTEI